ncbi:MAG: tetratricopeptide repeat protein, partial [Acidobacteria bacterium]|nr:tetratricopeptide repeat protein [Acidobacteriota bacterium]
SVMRSRDRVRIAAQLIYAPADRHLWAESYERDLRNILTLQKEIAVRVASGVRAKLTPQEKSHLGTARAVNPDAYEAYLRGSFHWRKLNEEGLKKSIEYFQKAIDIDSSYAPAYSGIATSFAVLGQQEILPPTVAYPQAKQAILKALELDDTLAEAHSVLGWISRNYDWDWPTAEREFKRAIELDPRSAVGHHGYAAYFEALGRFEDALNEQKLAQQLDPLSSFYNGQVALALMNARRYEEAVEQVRRTLELDPSNSRAYYALGVVHTHQGKYDQAIAELRKSADLSGGRFDVVARLGETYVRAGRRAEARKILAEWKEQSKHREVSPLGFATVYASLGEKEKAFAWLEKAYQERSPFLLSIRNNTAFDTLHTDPRFDDLMRRIGLPP